MSKNGKDIKKEGENSRPEAPLWKGVVKGVCVALLSLVAFLLLAVTGLTLWLTPERLTTLINTEASKNLNADVEVKNARFTLWSSFPHFAIEIDSIYVKSRSLNGLPESVAASLPAGSDYLASTSHVRGSINVIKLLSGDISLRDVIVDDVDLNLVAATDSIANYNIFPTSSTIGRVPHFSADKVIIRNPRNLRFFSRVSGADVKVDLSKASLVREKHEDNSYRLMLGGRVNAKVNRLTLLDHFAFGLSGEIAFRFDPFAIKLSDYNVALGNTRGKLNLDLQVGDELRLNDFSYKLGSFNLMRLLSSLPSDLIPVMNSLHADILVNASARLTTPYRFSATELPSMELDFNVEDGDIDYEFTNNKDFSVRHIGMGGRLVFDGADRNNSYIEIPAFSLQGEGTDLEIGARVSDIFTIPVVKVSLSGKSNVAEVGKMLNSVVPMNLAGSVETKLQVSFNVPDLQKLEFGDVKVGGDVKVDDFKFSYPGAVLNATGNALALELDGNAKSLTPSGVKDGDLQMKFTGGNINVKTQGTSLNLKNAMVEMDVRRFAKPLVVKDYRMPAEWSADKVSMDMTSHTSPFMQIDLPVALRDALKNWDAHLDVKVGEGVFLTPDFPVRNTFRSLHAEASTDSVVLHKLKFKSQSSGLTLAAKVSNLRQFLISKSVSPIYLSVDAALDTVQLNQLAGAYEYGRRIKGKPVVVSHNESEDTVYSSSDTTALLIPRNLIADINATAKMTRYTNLKLYDLATKLKIADGVASADHLDISSDFGDIGLGFKLNTANLQQMGLTLNGGIKDVNLVSFFKNFHALLVMMPQMKNLDGVLTAGVDARMDYFPNMFVNIPSLTANLDLKGRGLVVHQDKFIHKIAKMLLIRNSDDIHIANMNVRAHVGSNLLELFPFEFEFENYRLKMAGVNNFDGDMYYHIGVAKSMVPFPFGINIEGNFSDPTVRFGGERFKEKDASAITRNIMENHNVNMVKIAKKYMREFLHKAAQSDTTPQSAYVY